jgi:hypothetical protein
MSTIREMPRGTLVALGVGALLFAFLIGFVPQWNQARSLERELDRTRYELQMLELEGRLGAALAESQRGNYERARQLMTGFFSTLQQRLQAITDVGLRQELNALLEQRDEIITLLSRAEPEAVPRLNMMYTRYFAAVHPLGRDSPAIVTP